MPALELLEQYLNYYECPLCHFEWYEVWDCGCDSECTHCGTKNLTPEQSLQLPKGGPDELAIWQGEFAPLVDDEGCSPVDDDN